MRPVIAVDCDDVLCRYKERLCDWRNAETGSTWAVNDSPHFSIIEHWQVGLDEAYTIIDDFFRSPEIGTLDVIPGAVEALRILSQDCDIYVVTSRQAWSKELTVAWIEKHFGKDIFKGYLFGNAFVKGEGARTKSEMCREIGALTLIDDQVHHMIDVKKSAGIKRPILFNWASRHPWAQIPETKANPEDYEGIVECTSWEEIVVEVLKNIASSQ